MEPQLVKAQTKGETYRGFGETARWNVVLGEEVIGDVWRANDYRGKTCWMLESIHLPGSMPQSAVGGGYGRTTKQQAVREVVDWHANRERSFRTGAYWLHCGTHRELFGVVRASYVAERDDGACRQITTDHVLETKPHLGAAGAPGWYATAFRGGRLLCAHYCADETEAVSLILDEAFLPATPEEKRAPIAGYYSSRFYGALLDPEGPMRLLDSDRDGDYDFGIEFASLQAASAVRFTGMDNWNFA